MLKRADANIRKTLPHRLVRVTALAVQARYKKQVGTMASKDALEAKSELLKGKWVLITGASKGIGEAVAVKFAQQGAKIALVARSQDKLEDVIVRYICNNLLAAAVVLAPDMPKSLCQVCYNSAKQR